MRSAACQQEQEMGEKSEGESAGTGNEGKGSSGKHALLLGSRSAVRRESSPGE